MRDNNCAFDAVLEMMSDNADKMTPAEMIQYAMGYADCLHDNELICFYEYSDIIKLIETIDSIIYKLEA